MVEGGEAHPTADIKLVSSFSIQPHSSNAARSSASTNYPLTKETPEGERITERIQEQQWKANLRDKGNTMVAEALPPKVSASLVGLKKVAKPQK